MFLILIISNVSFNVWRDLETYQMSVWNVWVKNALKFLRNISILVGKEAKLFRLKWFQMFNTLLMNYMRFSLFLVWMDCYIWKVKILRSNGLKKEVLGFISLSHMLMGLYSNLVRIRFIVLIKISFLSNMWVIFSD